MNCPKCGSKDVIYTLVDCGLRESAKNAKGAEKANITRLINKLSPVMPTLFHKLERRCVCIRCHQRWRVDVDDLFKGVANQA